MQLARRLFVLAGQHQVALYRNTVQHTCSHVTAACAEDRPCVLLSTTNSADALQVLVQPDVAARVRVHTSLRRSAAPTNH